MNWNSNNHAANQIVQISGGLEGFHNYFYKKAQYVDEFGKKQNFTEKDLLFINGSGQNAALPGQGREYNQASCVTVLRVLSILKHNLEQRGSGLENVLAVTGGDEHSTVSGKAYRNQLTFKSVIAKTGTVGTNITLGGMVSTQKGNFLFFYNVETKNASKAEQNRSRTLISRTLNEFIKANGGAKQINYVTRYFDADRFEAVSEAESIQTVAGIDVNIEPGSTIIQ